MRRAHVPVRLPLDRLKDKKQGNHQTRTDAEPDRAGASASGNLPEPAPVESEMRQSRNNKKIAEPQMDFAPFMAIQAQSREPMPSLYIFY